MAGCKNLGSGLINTLDLVEAHQTELRKPNSSPESSSLTFHFSNLNFNRTEVQVTMVRLPQLIPSHLLEV